MMRWTPIQNGGQRTTQVNSFSVSSEELNAHSSIDVEACLGAVTTHQLQALLGHELGQIEPWAPVTQLPPYTELYHCQLGELQRFEPWPLPSPNSTISQLPMA